MSITTPAPPIGLRSCFRIRIKPRWHQGNTLTGTAKGWGGLVAEDLAAQGANNTSNPSLPLAISVAGANRFEVGTSGFLIKCRRTD